MSEATRIVRHRDGVPVYDYRTDLDIPPVSVLRFESVRHPTGPASIRDAGASDPVFEVRTHIHDFPALWYAHETGTVFVIGPGQVVEAAEIRAREGGVAVFFDPAALGGGRIPWPAWRSHPLLFPFLHGLPGGMLRLTVPADGRALWDNAIAAIEAELADRREGYQQAAAAHLTLLLIDVARLAADVVGDLRRSGESLLAEVFDVIEKRYGEPLSLRDVAAAVGITPGHLTTVVRHRTGRTVQDWIIDRRMSEARRLLTDTGLPVADIAHRVGIADPGYFSRLFHRTHGAPPRRWRERSAAADAQRHRPAG